MSASSLAEPMPMAVPAEKADAPRWSLATRVAFRFFFSFLLLTYLPFPLNLVPGVETVWQKLWLPVVEVAAAFLGVTVDSSFNGSGDRLFNWVSLFVTVVLAVAATLIWSVADRRALGYPRLHAWFRVYLRFGLAVAMISYGAFKVIPSQFVSPSLDRLIQPFGDASPMGLLWTFMGASAAYTIFTGIGELLGGLLLTMRRTALLGALVTAGVMTHVVMLNFAYDVPVKIYSSLLLITALFIAAPDARRLFDFFLRSPDQPVLQRRGLRIAARVIAAAFVLYIVGTSLKQSWDQRTFLREARLSGSPLYGIWNVDELTIDGVSRPPLITDTTRWRRFVVSGKEWGSIQNMDDSRTRVSIKLKEDDRSMLLTKRNDHLFEARFTYTRPDPNTLVLDGTQYGKRVVAKLRKAPADRTFLLTSRGFHWVNDVPFNR